MGNFYITTAIDYVNAKPHLGHAYEKIASDVIARWNRLLKNDVLFLTGTDENAQKNMQAAKKAGKDTQQFVDEMAENFRRLCRTLNISYDDFIRTTEERHRKVIQDIFEKMLKQGDIYKGEYEGLYCQGCEAFYTEKDLVGGKCPEHKTPCVKISEPSYFFRLSKYQKHIEKLLSKKEFLQPEGRRMEALNRVKEGLRDISVSRYRIGWGIPIKSDPKHTVYVWFDALLNYISALGYPNGEKYKKFWPADIHMIGTGINWFHSVIWPAMLESIGAKPPKRIFVHGYINLKGEKLSKTRGIVVDPFEIAEKYGVDQLRYFLIREAPFGEDMNFSEEALIRRINGELVSDLGNLVYRVMTLAEKYQDKIKGGRELEKHMNVRKMAYHMSRLELHLALNEVWKYIRVANRYINEKEPWKLKGKELGKVLYNLLEALRVIATLLWPFMPGACESIFRQLDVKEWDINRLKFRDIKGKPTRGEMLFRKIEVVEKEQETEKARDIKFTIGNGVKKIGIKAVAARITGVEVRKKKSGLEKLKKDAVEKTDLNAAAISPRILEFNKIYRELGAGVKHPVQNLVYLIQNSGKLPTINTVVDAYNVVALKRQLSIGAHDLDKIKGDVSLKLTTGSETYTPLGSNRKEKSVPGEYGLVDSANRMLCRMDIKQAEETKIDGNTKNVFLYVQGNSRVSDTELEEALKECCENITRFCGGSWKQLKPQA